MMSLIYLLGALIIIMVAVLCTLINPKFQRFAGQIALIAPIISSIYFFMANTSSDGRTFCNG